MVEQVTEKLNNTNLDPENQAAASSQEQTENQKQKKNEVDVKAV